MAKQTAKKGARKAPAEPKKTSARLYVVDEKAEKLWFVDVDGKQVTRRRGKIDGEVEEQSYSHGSPEKAHEETRKLIAKQRELDGYQTAEELSLDALSTIGGVASHPLEVAKTAQPKTPAEHSVDRIGGLPSGVSTKRWPLDDDDKPLGFLLQVDTAGVLRRHGGVAVFCATDGSATEDEKNNKVVLLAKNAWIKEPIDPPEGAVVLPAHAIRRLDSRFELREDRVAELAALDPAIGDAFDRLQKSDKVHDEVPTSKVGGSPVFLQGDESRTDFKLVAQLDFAGLDVTKAWPEAGLVGCLYVFVRKDERRAFAIWQHT